MDAPTAFVGIDPGSDGAISLFCPSEEIVKIADLYKAEPQDINATIIDMKLHYSIRMVMVEKVSAIQGAAAGSTFKFGYNIGMLHSLILANGLPMDLVTPRVWQKELRTTKKKGIELKKEVARLIKRLYPYAEVSGPKGGLKDGRSDSLSIAHYCYLKYK